MRLPRLAILVILLILAVLSSCQKNRYEIIYPSDSFEYDSIDDLVIYSELPVSFPQHIEGYDDPTFFSYGKGSDMAYYAGDEGNLLFAKHNESMAPSSLCIYQKIESSINRQASSIRAEGYLSNGKHVDFIGLLEDSDENGYRYREATFLGGLMSDTVYYVISDRPLSIEQFITIVEGFA